MLKVSGLVFTSPNCNKNIFMYHKLTNTLYIVTYSDSCRELLFMPFELKGDETGLYNTLQLVSNDQFEIINFQDFFNSIPIHYGENNDIHKVNMNEFIPEKALYVEKIFSEGMGVLVIKSRETLFIFKELNKVGKYQILKFDYNNRLFFQSTDELPYLEDGLVQIMTFQEYFNNLNIYIPDYNERYKNGLETLTLIRSANTTFVHGDMDIIPAMEEVINGKTVRFFYKYSSLLIFFIRHKNGNIYMIKENKVANSFFIYLLFTKEEIENEGYLDKLKVFSIIEQKNCCKVVTIGSKITSDKI